MKGNYYILLVNGLYDSVHTDYDSLNEYIENYSPKFAELYFEIIQLPYDNCVNLLADLIQNINLSDLWRIYDFIY